MNERYLLCKIKRMISINMSIKFKQIKFKEFEPIAMPLLWRGDF